MHSTKRRSTWVAAVLALVLVSAAAAGDPRRTAIVAMDDWPADSIMDPGTLSCPGGEIVAGPMGFPVCPASGRLHFRDTVAYACITATTAAGAPEPRFTGVLAGTYHGNFDADYTGALWGTWILVPAEICQKSALDAPAESWVGTFTGQRSLICTAAGCQWFGAIRTIGHGRGGSLEGQHFKGSETIVTFTPMPLPYELLGACPPSGPCPEGHLTGTIREK